ncbi:hypothetical protein AMPC_07710 [Anaeromyxobacter paludicola]|uniref:Secreted protein n=2 Tax=Anaeromyxobacter paludicola TaxID=2918171 RepID=A0ABN6N3D1_9BACT|nr:hypothetical protein AMPC_07710 [Anaeromyxobacter paludicola]
MWIFYFAVILVAATLLIASIVQNLRGPARQKLAQTELPTRAMLRVCLTELEALHREQSQRAWALASGVDRRDPLGDWNQWARDWEVRVDDLSDRCRLDVDRAGEFGLTERREMAAARDAMMALHRAYAAQVNRFAEEQAQLASGAAEAFRHAREAVAKE